MTPQTVKLGKYLVVRRFGRVRLFRVMWVYDPRGWFGYVYEERRRKLPLDMFGLVEHRICRAMRNPQGSLCWFPAYSAKKNRLLRLLMGKPSCKVFASYNEAAAVANKLIESEFKIRSFWTATALKTRYGWPLI